MHKFRNRFTIKMGMKMAITIKDIAREAGVSTATVSKVINNKMYVSPATKQKVLQVMEALNYVPNVSAANLARRDSKTILYADSFYKGLPYHNPHMFDIICGVSHELSRKGYRLSLLNMDSCEKKAGEVFEEAILSHVADGIIFSSIYANKQIERLMLQYDFPQICIGKPEFDTILSWIDTNHALSANLAVEYLLKSGCRKLAFIGGRKEEKIFMQRLNGFQTAMASNKLQINEDWISYNNPDVNEVYESVTKMMNGTETPDGLICANSLIGVGALRALKEMKIDVPGEVSLIAFDDYPYSQTVATPPTVIDIDMFSLGVHAGNLVLKKVRDPAMLIQTYTALPHLIERNTTRLYSPK